MIYHKLKHALNLRPPMIGFIFLQTQTHSSSITPSLYRKEAELIWKIEGVSCIIYPPEIVSSEPKAILTEITYEINALHKPQGVSTCGSDKLAKTTIGISRWRKVAGEHEGQPWWNEVMQESGCLVVGCFTDLTESDCAMVLTICIF